MYSDLLTGDLSDKRFYGVYRGIVVNSKDPEELDRIKVKIPQILGPAVTGWARCIRPAVKSNLNMPGNDTGVWVMFEGGDPNFPLWLGVF